MASSFTTSLGIEEMVTGEKSGTWGTISNFNWDIMDRIVAYTAVALADTSTATLTVREASPGTGTENLQNGMYRVIKFTGTLSQACTITIAPNTTKVFLIVINATTDAGSSGPYSLAFTQGSGANVTVQNSNSAVIYGDGAGGGAAIADAFNNLQIGNDLSLVSDSAVVNMGADNDITITHVADVGLKLKQAGATGDGSPFVLTLQTGELDIEADDVLGQIDFQAPDEATTGDSQLVAAGIAAVSEGAFSSINNATKLSFKTAASDTASEKMIIDSEGNIGINESSPSSYYGNAPRFAISNTTSGELTAITLRSATDGTGFIAFADSNSGNARFAGYVQYQHSSDLLSFGIAQAAEVRLSATAFYPASADGTALGLSTNEWSDLFLADGAVINFGDDQDITLTHLADAGLTTNGTFNAAVNLSINSQKFQSFFIKIANVGGTIKHNIFAEWVSAGVIGNYSGQITGASQTATTTPTVDVSTDFATGCGVNGAAIVFNTAAQVRVDSMAGATIAHNSTGTQILSGTYTGSRNVNGTTRIRLEVKISEVDGSNFDLNTTNIPSGKFIVVHIQGYLA